MAQQNLFPRDINKPRQPQRVASKPQAGPASTSGNRPTDAPRNYTAQFRPGSQQRLESAHLHSAVRPETRPASQREEAVRFSGRVGRYFEVKKTRNGNSLATFSLATEKPNRDESGNWAKRTVWQRIVAWGQTAEAISRQLSKGARVSVEGRFKTREWTDQENNLHSTTELVARRIDFLDSVAA